MRARFRRPDKLARLEDLPPTPRGPFWVWVNRGSGAYQAWEQDCARWMHRATVKPSVLLLFRFVSFLGDGLIWFLLVTGIVIWGGPHTAACLAQLAGMTALNLIVYKLIKRTTGRRRPFVTCPGIRVCANVLDEYSFPSGHTLHAVAVGMLVSAYYPLLMGPMILFAVLVAASRVVLGLHYPSDVVMGAAMGALSAWGALSFF